ncbi:hypothetical protein ABID19_001226 [Mesorhizobium robiniae]|uniref:DUF3168 domain-containing protein n=1 Tax=Mesorhizobium robiniae TaxID=559315 RepID=A0ABV2GIV5_9HYPH
MSEFTMLEPTTALQIAIRERLILDANVFALVPRENIRSNFTRPDKMPAVLIGNGTTELHGHDYAGQRAAWVYLDIHVWTIGEGLDATKALAFAVSNSLDHKKLQIEGGYCDHFKVTRIVYPRDPNPDYGHGVLSVEALIRWVV